MKNEEKRIRNEEMQEDMAFFGSSLLILRSSFFILQCLVALDLHSPRRLLRRQRAWPKPQMTFVCPGMGMG